MTRASGFTLIELLLYVSMLSIMMLSITMFLSLMLQSRVKEQVMSEVEQQGQLVMQEITQSVRNASAITAPTAGSAGTSLSVTVPAPNSPTVFDLSAGVLRITEGAGSAVGLTNSKVTASSLLISNLSRASTPGVVRVEFTLTYNSTSTLSEYSYSKSFTTSVSRHWP